MVDFNRDFNRDTPNIQQQTPLMGSVKIAIEPTMILLMIYASLTRIEASFEELTDFLHKEYNE